MGPCWLAHFVTASTEQAASPAHHQANLQHYGVPLVLLLLLLL
jgi:hypothetical protein